MEREEALELLAAIQGADLVQLASKHGQRIFHEKELEGVLRRTLNKGWAGLTLEAYLGIPKNSSSEPNGGSWELKQASLRVLKSTGGLTAKETLQITMLNKDHVIQTPFEQSQMLHKIARLVIVARLYVDKNETRSPIVIIRSADLSDVMVPAIYNQVQQDYEMIRAYLREHTQPKTVSGRLIQIRTKGQKDSNSYAFYARTQFVNILLGLNK